MPDKTDILDWRRKDEEDASTLEATWWLFDREAGMDDLADQAGDSLKKMAEDLEVFPFQDTEGNDRLFLARFEFPKYQESFQHADGVFLEEGKTPGFIDFLTGFPLECVELMVMIGELSSKKDKVAVVAGDGYAAPPVPGDFFAGYDEDRILLNYLYLASDYAQWMADNLSGEPEPENLHWWLRTNLAQEDAKFPVPGEFLGLGLRLMPDKPWGEQKSSPFLYAGNWMDTVYYTGAVITEVIAADDSAPYPRYKVRWRVTEQYKDGIIDNVKPSDFAEYQVGDRVTVLKDVSVEKQSQRWKDEDMKKFGETWIIAPITFYGLDKTEE